MVRFVHRFETLARGSDGALHLAFACARRRSDERWEGWLVFVPLEEGPAVATDRETTQSSLEAVHYWAGGLGPVYLEGALARACARSSEAPSPPRHALASVARASTPRAPRWRRVPLATPRLSTRSRPRPR